MVIPGKDQKLFCRNFPFPQLIHAISRLAAVENACHIGLGQIIGFPEMFHPLRPYRLLIFHESSPPFSHIIHFLFLFCSIIFFVCFLYVYPVPSSPVIKNYHQKYYNYDLFYYKVWCKKSVKHNFTFLKKKIKISILKL